MAQVALRNIVKTFDKTPAVQGIDLDIADLDMERGETTLMPDLRKCALLLDIDGTILDLAPSPQQVWVPTGLVLIFAGRSFRIDSGVNGSAFAASLSRLKIVSAAFPFNCWYTIDRTSV